MDDLKAWRYQITLFGLLLTTSACTQAVFTAGNLPTHFSNITVVHDRAYGPDPAQKLDIY